jgi:hypothetical protein
MSRLLFCALALAGCGSSAGDPADLATGPADLAQPADKSIGCASTFGTALTAGFGRVDGTIRAVVRPGHPTCALPNNDHLVLQVDFGGATYRMVVNVESDRAGDPQVRMATLESPLVGGAFADGWHVPSGLDYVQSLSAHSTSFTPHSLDELTTLITAELEIGAPVSVFSSTDGGSSTHLIHRNAPGEDGAIVVHPTTAPRYLMFAFATQTF